MDFIGLGLWRTGLLSSMDASVIGCWSAYLIWATWRFMAHRAAYGSPVTRRLLTIVLALSGSVLGLRVMLALQATSQGSFLRSSAYLAVLAICLAAACFILFLTLGRGRFFATYPMRDADWAGLEDRLDAAMGARIFLDPQMSLSGLAAALEAPPRRVSKLINARYGMNVAAFLNRCRVEVAARRLLAEPDQPIKAVMYDAGFVSKSIFNGEFQRWMGVTPSAYRRQGAERHLVAATSIRPPP